ncbi:hypothetical protein JW930_05975 [Candidatus Woesearchaeota archaeon]|nr:hypothetical protein [Candidatus Woesearchaeota archaeon]
MVQTKPKPIFPKEYVIDPNTLAAQRYGTLEMVEIWGAEATMDYSLQVQGQAAVTLSELYPDLVPPDHASEIAGKASIRYVSPDRIRELEARTGHDVIAINTALEEQVSPEAGAHINKAKTSADTTQPARALQLKRSLVVIADSVENLRDILLEVAMEGMAIPHMDQSHLIDALPTFAGRPLVHYAEMLQSDLRCLKYVHDNSIIGKWADATGNHHSATLLGIDGILLQQEYCKALGIGYMDAPAQLPGLEFEADIAFAMARIAETMNNIARYLAMGKGTDTNVFSDTNPRRRKGSSGMPHKDMVGGNPTAEEQVMSLRNYLHGLVATALDNCQFPYCRDLSASSNARINFEDGFKYLDHCIRRLASAVYWLGINEDRSRERVERTFGVVTSQAVMTYLTDQRFVANPMVRSEAHNLTARLATEAYEQRRPYIEVLLECEEVTSRIDEQTLRKITDPSQYVGESQRIIQTVFNKYYQVKTLTG